MTRPVRVVVADDSPFICKLMSSYLQSSPDIEVVGTALNGKRAIKLVQELRPDAVTLDLEMPGMHGLEVLEYIMHECPTPVIIISGVSGKGAAITLSALELGAVDFILKYTPGVDTNAEALRQEIIDKVRTGSTIKMIRSLRTGQAQRSLRQSGPELTAISPVPIVETPEVGQTQPNRQELTPYLPGGVIVIGASTGGPMAVRDLLKCLPVDFPGAIIVVQHIPASFTQVLAAQLNRQVPLTVKEATADDCLKPGLVLVAPGDYHLLLQPSARVELNQGPEIMGHRPSIDVTMQSVAQIYGSRTTGVVLTGMGSDGSQGLVAIRAKGGKTFAQDTATSVVSGMPQRAVEKGVVDRVGSPSEIGKFLMHVSRFRN